MAHGRCYKTYPLTLGNIQPLVLALFTLNMLGQISADDTFIMKTILPIQIYRKFPLRKFHFQKLKIFR